MLNRRKIGLSTCSAGRAFLVEPLTLCSACESQAQPPQLHQDIVTTGCWARPALCWTNPGNPRPSRFLPIFACPAGLWLPSLRFTPGSCLPAPLEAAWGFGPTGAFLTGKLAANLLLGLSPSTATTGWKQQYFNSTGGAGQKCLAGETLLLPLLLVQLKSCHPAVRCQRTEGVQVRALSLLLVSLTVLRLKSQSHKGLTCSQSDTQP